MFVSRVKEIIMLGHVVCVLTLCIVSVSSQLLQNIPKDFQPILSKIISESKSKVRIAKASDNLEVKGHKAIARVIKHTDADSRFARTVIIQNSPEAYRAFGVRNAPNTVLVRSEKEPDVRSNLDKQAVIISKDSDMEITGQAEKKFDSQITHTEDNARPEENGNNANIANITNLPAQTGNLVNIQNTTEVNRFHSQKDTATTDVTSSIKRNLGNEKVIIKNKTTTFPGIPRRVRSYSTSNTQDKKNMIELHVDTQSAPPTIRSELDEMTYSVESKVIFNGTKLPNVINKATIGTYSNISENVKQSSTASPAIQGMKSGNTSPPEIPGQIKSVKSQKKRHISNYFQPSTQDSRAFVPSQFIRYRRLSRQFRPPGVFHHGFKPIPHQITNQA